MPTTKLGDTSGTGAGLTWMKTNECALDGADATKYLCVDPSVKILATVPKFKSVLIINHSTRMFFTEPMPSPWHRLLTRIVLGWIWEPYDEDAHN